MSELKAPKRYSWLTDMSGRQKIMLAILPLLGLFLTASVVTLDSLRLQEQNRRETDRTYNVLLAINEVRQAYQGTMLGVRGYVLSLSQNELNGFLNGRKQFAKSLEKLNRLLDDNPTQQLRLDALQAPVKKWEAEIETGMIAPLLSQQKVEPAQAMAARIRILDNYLATRKVEAPDISNVLTRMAAAERLRLDRRSHELEKTLHDMRLINGIAILLGFLFGMYVIRLATRLITTPLRQMTDIMNRVAAHDTSVVVTRLQRKDEIGEIARALQVFKQMVIEIKEQTWVKSQLATISRELQAAATHRDFGMSLTSQLAPLLNVGVALYYICDPESGRLDLLGSYGLRQSWEPAGSYVPGEGLVGQCVLERRTIELDRIPEPYVRIHSASGEALPTHLVIVPVMYRDQVKGVLELAGFEPISVQQRALLNELLQLVALTQENLSRAASTQELLERTQKQAEDLRVSELSLRQQKTALRVNNEVLQAQTAELEEQSERLASSEEELRVQAEELQASNEELRAKTDSLNQQRDLLVELQKETAAKAEELARSSQYKSEFLANMSHELRTPLNSLLILSHSLAENREGNLDEEQVESARIINDAGSSLLRLINDILDLSKIEAGKMELMLQDYPLEDLLRSVRRNFDHVAREKGLEFTAELAPDLPSQIHTDPGKLEQVINNLLANAFKFTAKGSVHVHIGRPDETLTLPETVADKALLAISVRDSGIGIPADKLTGVFNAFEQVDASTSRQFGGTGLGLSISRRIAELLGGDIVLRSEIGVGSEFILLLAERCEGEEAAAPAAASPAAPVKASRPIAVPALLPGNLSDDRDKLNAGDPAILVVEDDPVFARILAEMLRKKGHHILLAANGENGLALARRYRPLGILLDVMLPGMDGWTVIERLKTDPVTRHIPVHFLSATGEETRGRELGAVGFLTKPVSRDAINEAFDKLLHFAAGRSRHLLVVDDDTDARSAVRTLLRQDDVVIDEAGSAEEALQKISQTGYDCVVLDLGLPGMSGMDLLKELADSGSVPPVVVYSGRELTREENLEIRQYTDSIVVKGARSPDRLLDEVSLFLHSIRPDTPTTAGRRDDRDVLEGRKLLIVDDDMRNLFALSKVLRGWGVVVSMAQDGHKALSLLDGEDTPELVLMDIMMPGMDGYETMRAIRAKPQFAELPIIALTAKAMRGDRELCLEAGASDYLSKPIDIDKLASMIRVWLRR